VANDRDNDELEAKRLADYSDAVLRGQPWNDRGIDPRDAEIIRQLHALGTSYLPSSDYLAEAQRKNLQRASLSSPDQSRPSSASYAEQPPNSSDQALPPKSWTKTETADEGWTVDPLSQSTGYLSRAFIGARDNFWKVLAAALVLFIGAGALALLVIAARGDDSSNNIAAPGSTATFQPILTQTVIAALPATPASSPSSILSPTAVPSATIAPSPTHPPPESFEIYPILEENSSVGKETPTNDYFRPVTIDFSWDGTGAVVLSGCPDRACNIVLDDQLKMTITNNDGVQAPVFIGDNGTEDGQSRALPVLLTSVFRKGENKIQANLIDRQGDKRGTRTPVYVIILR
jgi:hypothetical protein